MTKPSLFGSIALDDMIFLSFLSRHWINALRGVPWEYDLFKLNTIFFPFLVVVNVTQTHNLNIAIVSTFHCTMGLLSINVNSWDSFRDPFLAQSYCA